MPPHFQPPRLQDLLVFRVAEMVFRSCIVIERKYGHLEWSTSQQQEVSDLQGFLLSRIGPLFNEVCIAINDIQVFKYKEKPLTRVEKWEYFKDNWKYSHVCYAKLKDFRIYSSVLVHDRMRLLKLDETTPRMFKNEISLSECQIEKFSCVVELDILGVTLTDKVMEGIGRTCTNLQKIRFAVHAGHSSLESVCNSLLRCREIDQIDIEFDEWFEDQFTGRANPFIMKLFTELPKLKLLRFLEGDYNAFLPKLTSVTSLQELSVVANADEITHIFEMCPHVKHLSLSSSKNEDKQKLVSALAHCSLEIETLELSFMTLGETMNSLLELKGCNLTRLRLNYCKGRQTTLNDIYTIAKNCPKIEELSIMEYGDDDMTSEFNPDPPNQFPTSVPQTSTITTSHMFRNLTALDLGTVTLYGLRLLLPTLLYANSLTFLSMFAKYEGIHTHGFHDILADVLNTNTWPELEILALKFSTESRRPSPWTSRASIERLVDSCPKLSILQLWLPLKEDAVSYIKELKEKIKNENFNLLLFATDCSLGLPLEDPGSESDCCTDSDFDSDSYSDSESYSESYSDSDS